MQEWIVWMVSSVNVFGSVLNIKKSHCVSYCGLYRMFSG